MRDIEEDFGTANEGDDDSFHDSDVESLFEFCTGAPDKHVDGEYLLSIEGQLRAYPWAPLKSLEIRLMAIHPAVQNDEPVHFDLETHDVDSGVMYHTLSYAWGPCTADYLTETVFANGLPMRVTAHLHAGLQWSRSISSNWEGSWSGKKLTLWIDAICINQKDLDERNRQVRMMGEIYKHGTSLIVWLGQKLFPDECQELQKFKASILAEQSTHLEADWAVPRSDMRNMNWFLRRWVYQEVKLSKRRIFLIAGKVVSDKEFPDSICDKYSVIMKNNIWSEYSDDMRNVVWNKYKDNTRNSIGDKHGIVMRNSIWGKYSVLTRNSTWDKGSDRMRNSNALTLMENLVLCRESGMRCSNTLDNIFSLLSISINGNLITVDYEQNMSALCLSVARDHVVQQYISSAEMAVLLINAVQPRPSKQGLPSWVPCWTSSDAGSQGRFMKTLQQEEHLHRRHFEWLAEQSQKDSAGERDKPPPSIRIAFSLQDQALAVHRLAYPLFKMFSNVTLSYRYLEGDILQLNGILHRLCDRVPTQDGCPEIPEDARVLYLWNVDVAFILRPALPKRLCIQHIADNTFTLHSWIECPASKVIYDTLKHIRAITSSNGEPGPETGHRGLHKGVSDWRSLLDNFTDRWRLFNPYQYSSHTVKQDKWCYSLLDEFRDALVEHIPHDSSVDQITMSIVYLV